MTRFHLLSEAEHIVTVDQHTAAQDIDNKIFPTKIFFAALSLLDSIIFEYCEVLLIRLMCAHQEFTYSIIVFNVYASCVIISGPNPSTFYFYQILLRYVDVIIFNDFFSIKNLLKICHRPDQIQLLMFWMCWMQNYNSSVVPCVQQ